MKKKSKAFEDLGLIEFPSLSDISECNQLSLCKNPIRTLDSLPTIQCLEELDLSNTMLESFEGTKKQPRLKRINIDYTPLSYYAGVNIMALLAFGLQIENVGNSIISESERKIASNYHNKLEPLILKGFVITWLNPVRLVHSRTYEWIVIEDMTIIPLSNCLIPVPAPMTPQINKKPLKRKSSIDLVNPPDLQALRCLYSHVSTRRIIVKSTSDADLHTDQKMDMSESPQTLPEGEPINKRRVKIVTKKIRTSHTASTEIQEPITPTKKRRVIKMKPGDYSTI